MNPLRSIKVVARETGLSVHAIRVWERRYGAVQPTRAGNNRRLYNEQDVERLRLLHQATSAGHSIGQIAQATTAELDQLLRQSLTRGRPAAGRSKRTDRDATEDLMNAALRATERLDSGD